MTKSGLTGAIAEMRRTLDELEVQLGRGDATKILACGGTVFADGWRVRDEAVRVANDFFELLRGHNSAYPNGCPYEWCDFCASRQK